MNLDKKIDVTNVYLLNDTGTISKAINRDEKTLGEVIAIRQKMKSDLDQRIAYLKALDEKIETEAK